MSSLEIQCPHCCHVGEDTWEALDVNRLDSARCEDCGRCFFFAVIECRVCDAETPFSWDEAPPAGALDLLSCRRCGCRHSNHEAAEEDES
jgi:uncharacterized OB-fold protein